MPRIPVSNWLVWRGVRDKSEVAARTGDVEGVACLGHQAPWAGCVEEGGRVVDLEAGGGSVIRFELCERGFGECEEGGYQLETHLNVCL